MRRDLALERRLTVVVTIHQPPSRVMGTFDALLLLAEGRRLFYGSVAGIAPYFERVAVVPNALRDEPGDFALDLAVGDPGSAANTRDGGERGENVNVNRRRSSARPRGERGTPRPRRETTARKPERSSSRSSGEGRRETT